MEAKEIKISNIEELDTIINCINEKINSIKENIKDERKGKWKLYFRGEAKKYDEVNASIFRDDFLLKNEGEYLRSLLKNANLGNKLSLVELGKIQHYGGCTRLLDFTKNFNVALYFVCCEHDIEDGFVYCYKTESIDDENSEICKILSEFTFLESHNLEQGLQQISRNHNKDITEIIDIVHRDWFIDFALLRNENLRMTRQEGLFLWMGDTNIRSESREKGKAAPLSDENGRGKEYSGVIMKVKIPKELKGEIRKYLRSSRPYTKEHLIPDEPNGAGINFHSAERKYFEELIAARNVK